MAIAFFAFTARHRWLGREQGHAPAAALTDVLSHPPNSFLLSSSSSETTASHSGIP